MASQSCFRYVHAFTYGSCNSQLKVIEEDLCLYKTKTILLYKALDVRSFNYFEQAVSIFSWHLLVFLYMHHTESSEIINI